jgi:3-oxoacyl-[acyl-carrier-protein] synthase II
LKEAGVKKEEIDMINCHATSTVVGDIAELKSMKDIAKVNKTVTISANKSNTGHAFVAAGAIESIFSILSIEHSLIPRIRNLESPISEDFNFPMFSKDKKLEE